MTNLIVNDFESGLDKTYANADAAAYEQAFADFATPQDYAKLATSLNDGFLAESWSGKSTGIIERSSDPLGYWLRMCALIETDNQTWEVR